MTFTRTNNHAFARNCERGKRFGLAPSHVVVMLTAGLLFFLAGAGEFAVAQDIFGRIAGTITDSSGSAVPSLKVTIINEDTHVARAVTADKNGYYVADELPVGI